MERNDDISTLNRSEKNESIDNLENSNTQVETDNNNDHDHTEETSNESNAKSDGSWYIVQAIFRSKLNVNKLIDKIFHNSNDEEIEDVYIPTVIERIWKKNAVQPTKVETCVMPGYIFIKSTSALNIHSVLTKADVNFRKITPIAETEIINMKQKFSEEQTNMQITNYKIGDLVRISQAPFNGLQGVIESIEYDKEQVKVSVSMFGRQTPVNLTFAQIDKVGR